MLGGNNGVNAAAHVEIADHGHLPGLTGSHEIVEDPVDHVFVKRALVAEGPKVKLHRFEFEAQLIRHVLDADRSEVWLPRAWTYAGELGAFHADLVISPAPGIGKGFQLLAWLSQHA
jgi:hypothetical protein